MEANAASAIVASEESTCPSKRNTRPTPTLSAHERSACAFLGPRTCGSQAVLLTIEGAGDEQRASATPRIDPNRKP
jgi:hypothetical protein